MANAHQYGGKARPAEESLDRSGRQTPQQAALTQQGSGGKSDADRNTEWSEAGGEPGLSPVSLGGSSAGKSDQAAGQGASEDRKVAGGLYRSERDEAQR